MDVLEQYRTAIIDLIVSIDKHAVHLKEKDQVLIVISLDTIAKMRQFNDWVKSKLKGENDLQATETEIVRAAVRIGKQLPPE